MSQRFGARGDGFGMSRRPRTEIVITSSGRQSSGIRLERNRPTWDLEAEADIDPPPQPRKQDQKKPPK